MNPILMAIILVTVIGLIGAVILVAASIFMYVPVDERVEKITGVWPAPTAAPAAVPVVPTMPRASLRTGTPSTSAPPAARSLWPPSRRSWVWRPLPPSP